MTDHTLDWLGEKAIGWSHTPPVNKIDTHHHFVPPFYAKAIADQGGDPSGWPTPRWTPLASKLLMNRLGVQTAILSATAPGACIMPAREGRAQLARQLNEYAAALRDSEPTRFGFFVSLPNILDTEDALAEIAYGLDVLHADGVVLFTRYVNNGDNSSAYLGHRDIEPIWTELNNRRAVVFIHPTHPADTTPINPRLPQPLVDYPHETTRSALDMITAGTPLRYPDCKIILSHAGGTLPYLISRVTTPLRHAPGVVASHKLGTTHEKALAAFRAFYFDLALSAAPHVLDLLFKIVDREHVLFGSDFPYAPVTAYPGFAEELENYEEMGEELREMVYWRNAKGLFPGLVERNNTL
ncbi:hypothetical protein BJY01DRAFT_244027 [Aspergillus pseudoustus]|uniref:6-methylsalicylate decarboxylase n=1 Tax=Aspergillus pseudoustus TaxID=1810923 RepID=A0ABR4KMA4_9EURO